MGTRVNTKLRKTLGAKKIAPMKEIPAAEARPGAWKEMLLPAPVEDKAHKGRHEPLAIDEAVLEAVADGGKAAEIEAKFELRAGYVRSVLVRRFGSVEGMKKALQAQCLENAIALNEHAMSNLQAIAPHQALAGAKIMIDGAVSLDKNTSVTPSTVDFAALAILGSTLERLEKRVQGIVIDVEPSS